MIDVLGWLAVIGIVSYLGHHLFILLDSDSDDYIITELRQEESDLNRQNLQAKFAQLRIRQRAIDAEIKKWEAHKKNPQIQAKKLKELRAESATVREQISKIVEQL